MLALTDEPTSRRADAQMGGRGRPDPTSSDNLHLVVSGPFWQTDFYDQRILVDSTLNEKRLLQKRRLNPNKISLEVQTIPLSIRMSGR